MNMFAEKFSILTTKYPQNADALMRLASYFEGMEKRHGDRYKQIKLDPQRLFDISEAGSAGRLCSVISQLISEKLIRRKIIVRTPSGGGVEFNSIADLPQILRDPDRDIDIEVTPEIVSTIYIPVVE